MIQEVISLSALNGSSEINSSSPPPSPSFSIPHMLWRSHEGLPRLTVLHLRATHQTSIWISGFPIRRAPNLFCSEDNACSHTRFHSNSFFSSVHVFFSLFFFSLLGFLSSHASMLHYSCPFEGLLLPTGQWLGKFTPCDHARALKLCSHWIFIAI